MARSYFVLKRKNTCPHSVELIAEQFFHLKDAKRWYKATRADAMIDAKFIILRSKFRPKPDSRRS